MSTLLDHLSRWRPFTAIVVGDFMLDQLVYGNADRLSPEAPVPVLHVQRSEDRPGGAANVCLDLAAMRGTVHAVGVTGDDRDADLLRSALLTSGIQSDSLIADPARPTTVKRSLIGLAQHRHPQKMFRVDHESREPLSSAVAAHLLAEVERLLPGAHVLCIEDYNKGVCTPEVCQSIIAAARRHGAPVLVDPANIDDYSKYRGASTITPNRTEATGATGDRLPPEARPEDFAPIAQRLLTELDLEVSIITLDRHGCLLLEKDAKSATVVPTYARQVYDVTGAGDMVLAALAAARANAIDWHDAVKFANAAAGLEVEVFGVVPMPMEKIHRECLLRERDLHGSGATKQRTVDQLQIELSAVRHDRKSVVFANGCFDVLHPGHISLLQRAAGLGDYLIVAINDDASVRRLKGADRPVFAAADRVAMLSALGCVDAVVVFQEDTAVPLIQALRPDILVKGDQYDLDKVPEAIAIRQLGGRVETLSVVEGKSTTSIVSRVRAPNPRP